MCIKHVLTLRGTFRSSSHLLLYLVLSVQCSFHCIKELLFIDQTVGPLLCTNNNKHTISEFVIPVRKASSKIKNNRDVQHQEIFLLSSSSFYLIRSAYLISLYLIVWASIVGLFLQFIHSRLVGIFYFPPLFQLLHKHTNTHRMLLWLVHLY